MSEICPHCGDGPESVGTNYHIECVEDLKSRISIADARIVALENARDAAIDHAKDLTSLYDELEAENERLRWMLKTLFTEYVDTGDWGRLDLTKADLMERTLADLESRWTRREGER